MEAPDIRTGDPPVGESAGALPRFAVVDIETSGLSDRRHRILQIAAATVENGEVVDEWSSLISGRASTGLASRPARC